MPKRARSGTRCAYTCRCQLPADPRLQIRALLQVGHLPLHLYRLICHLLRQGSDLPLQLRVHGVLLRVHRLLLDVLLLEQSPQRLQVSAASRGRASASTSGSDRLRMRREERSQRG